MKLKPIALAALLIPVLGSCYKESRLLVNADFQATIEENNYTAPVKITLENTTTGADFYEWTFEGGTPATSSEKTPARVTYAKAGNYLIKLRAWNDHEQDEKTFSFAVDSAVTVSFQAEALINDFAPAQIHLTNTTQGASSFVWTFDGGVPATSTDRNPADVTFGEAGEHTITLTASNGRESFTTTRTILLNPPLTVAFDIEPSFDDFDYEAPFTASLVNRTISGLTYEWTASGGTLAAPLEESTSIRIDNPGTYTITLKGDNRKENKFLSKEITIKTNSNLYTMRDVRFGIKAAASTVGSFYSLSRRAVIPQNEVTDENGKDISLVFFAINQSFEKCYFTSPHLATGAGFYAIPDAATTYFVNTIESSGLQLSSNAFDAMTTDAPLQALNIRGASSTTTWFIANPVPRIVLFEAADGRKGAIKIKAFVSEQGQSYILTDLKFQKEKQP